MPERNRQTAATAHQRKLDRDIAGKPGELGELDSGVGQPRPGAEGLREAAVLGQRARPPHVGKLAAGQLNDLVAYLATLQGGAQ